MWRAQLRDEQRWLMREPLAQLQPASPQRALRSLGASLDESLARPQVRQDVQLPERLQDQLRERGL